MLHCSKANALSAFALGGSELEQPLGVDTGPLQARTPVEVRPGGPAGGPDPPQDVSLCHLVSRLDPVRLQVKVHRKEPSAVMHDHRLAAEEEVGGEGDPAPLAGTDRPPP